MQQAPHLLGFVVSNLLQSLRWKAFLQGWMEAVALRQECALVQARGQVRRLTYERLPMVLKREGSV